MVLVGTPGMVLCISRIVQPPLCDAIKSQHQTSRCSTCNTCDTCNTCNTCNTRNTQYRLTKLTGLNSPAGSWNFHAGLPDANHRNETERLESEVSWVLRLVSCLSISPFRNLGIPPLKIQSLRIYFQCNCAGLVELIPKPGPTGTVFPLVKMGSRTV